MYVFTHAVVLFLLDEKLRPRFGTIFLRAQKKCMLYRIWLINKFAKKGFVRVLTVMLQCVWLSFPSGCEIDGITNHQLLF